MKKRITEKRKKMMITIGSITFLLAIAITIFFSTYINKAKKQLATYDSLVKSTNTSYGKMSYIDAGEGEETILVSHGLFGGYDQGYNTIKGQLNHYRVLAPSRFGYVGTDLPKNSTVIDQAYAYAEFLDTLNVDKVYILGTSAGGTSAIRFAMQYPERVKGLILYCSGATPMEKPLQDKSPNYAAVPKLMCHDFGLWAIGPIMQNMMSMPKNTWLSVFPVSKRRSGVINDGYHANRDLIANYDEYKIEEINVPVLALHAKDDKMADYKAIETMVNRFPNKTLISFETGGHMMYGNSDAVDMALNNFINETK